MSGDEFSNDSASEVASTFKDEGVRLQAEVERLFGEDAWDEMAPLMMEYNSDALLRQLEELSCVKLSEANFTEEAQTL
ncbi:MAG: hypothetical protein V3V61_00425 [Gammaproteobacteria bacterium]